MEDYQSAFLERRIDTESLHKANRAIAAMHFGGITVECFLKAIILSSIPTKAASDWKTNSHDPGHTLTNPKHSLVEALKRHNRLFHRVQKNPAVVKRINEIENPSQHFIDLRYSSKQPDDYRYKEWYKSYKSLLSWLQCQSTQL